MRHRRQHYLRAASRARVLETGFARNRDTRSTTSDESIAGGRSKCDRLPGRQAKRLQQVEPLTGYVDSILRLGLFTLIVA